MNTIQHHAHSSSFHEQDQEYQEGGGEAFKPRHSFSSSDRSSSSSTSLSCLSPISSSILTTPNASSSTTTTTHEPQQQQTNVETPMFTPMGGSLPGSTLNSHPQPQQQYSNLNNSSPAIMSTTIAEMSNRDHEIKSVHSNQIPNNSNTLMNSTTSASSNVQHVSTGSMTSHSNRPRSNSRVNGGNEKMVVSASGLPLKRHSSSTTTPSPQLPNTNTTSVTTTTPGNSASFHTPLRRNSTKGHSGSSSMAITKASHDYRQFLRQTIKLKEANEIRVRGISLKYEINYHPFLDDAIGNKAFVAEMTQLNKFLKMHQPNTNYCCLGFTFFCCTFGLSLLPFFYQLSSFESDVHSYLRALNKKYESKGLKWELHPAHLPTDDTFITVSLEKELDSNVIIDESLLISPHESSHNNSFNSSNGKLNSSTTVSDAHLLIQSK